MGGCISFETGLFFERCARRRVRNAPALHRQPRQAAQGDGARHRRHPRAAARRTRKMHFHRCHDTGCHLPWYVFNGQELPAHCACQFGLPQRVELAEPAALVEAHRWALFKQRQIGESMYVVPNRRCATRAVVLPQSRRRERHQETLIAVFGRCASCRRYLGNPLRLRLAANCAGPGRYRAWPSGDTGSCARRPVALPPPSRSCRRAAG